MLSISVQNGTSAGWKKLKAAVSKTEWKCEGCGQTPRYYWTRCPRCHSPRPNDH